MECRTLILAPASEGGPSCRVRLPGGVRLTGVLAYVVPVRLTLTVWLAAAPRADMTTRPQLFPRRQGNWRSIQYVACGSGRRESSQARQRSGTRYSRQWTPRAIAVRLGMSPL